MRIKTAFVAALLLLAQPLTFAQYVQVENAVETLPDSLIVPTSTNGMMAFKPWCEGECPDGYQRARLTPATTFFIDDKPVKFDEFRKRFATMRFGDDSYSLVNYNVKTNTVTRVKVNQ